MKRITGPEEGIETLFGSYDENLKQLEAALFWTGCVYNFCHVHATLAGTPAMAADLTDHVWTIDELIRYRRRRE